MHKEHMENDDRNEVERKDVKEKKKGIAEKEDGVVYCIGKQLWEYVHWRK